MTILHGSYYFELFHRVIFFIPYPQRTIFRNVYEASHTFDFITPFDSDLTLHNFLFQLCFKILIFAGFIFVALFLTAFDWYW